MKAIEKYKGSLGTAVTGGLDERVTPWAGASVRTKAVIQPIHHNDPEPH